MGRKLILAAFPAVFLLSVACYSATAQAQEAQNEVMRQQVEQPPMPQDESEMQWVWGDVVNVDGQNRSIVVKCLDYETDQEKEMTINTDDKTVYENVKSLDEIKPKDTLSIDYIVSSDNKNMARNVSKEAAEVAGETEQKPAETATPAGTAPAGM